MKRHPSFRWLSALFMTAVSVGLVILSGVWYTTARQPYLISHPIGVTVVGADPLDTDLPMEPYGVLSAARALDGQGRTTGYILVVAQTGYKSVIRLQCTFSADGTTLAGVQVISQDETPYLGSRITSHDFTASFAGRRMPIKLWTTTTLGSPVDGLTGSTISAQAVVDGVNNAHRYLQAYLAAE